MAFESVRGYVQLATGLGDLTRARATEAAQGLLSLPGQAAGGGTARVAGQVSALADELLSAAATNRENLLALVRSEIDAAVLRMGLARASELEAALERISVLRSQVAELRATAAFAAAEQARGVASVEQESTTRPAPTRAAKKSTATKSAAAKKSTAKKSTATKSAAAKKSTAKKSTATKSTATKSTATKSAAKKSAAKKSAAKKSSPGGTRAATPRRRSRA